jgi:excinuclease ABC subunit A
VLNEIKSKIHYLIDSGLSYITLDRRTSTLSRGEFQRINLSFTLGSTLSDSLLIIDQPSSDLHPTDYRKIKIFLEKLKSQGNTILIIEHNREMVNFSDYLLELGPSSGINGGHLVYSGNKEDFFDSSNTLTQKCFRAPLKFKQSPRLSNQWLSFKNANTHNLKNFDFKIPKSSFTVIAGVSGAGKTTLLFHEIFQKNKHHNDIGGMIFIEPTITSAKSNSTVAVFSDIFPFLRNLFAQLKESRIHHFTPAHFSPFTPQGRCEHCKGKGHKNIEMQFLPSIRIICKVCEGKGFNRDVLKIRFRDKNIREILDCSVTECKDFLGKDLPFKNTEPLINLIENGMGYLKLGQKLSALSPGELHRIKLIKHLNKKRTHTLFLLDEPCLGLHYYDIELLKKLIDKVISNNNTVVAVEHNINLISHADYLIELGKEGGQKGGYLIFEGYLKDALNYQESITGGIIKKIKKSLTNLI